MESQRLSIKNKIIRLINRCNNVQQLQQIHAQIITSPHLTKPDFTFLISRLLFFTTTTLAQSSSSSASLSYPARVFHHTPNPNLFMYNCIIRAYSSKINDPTCSKSLLLYKKMLFDNISPDCITMPFVVKECGKRGDVFAGQCVHCHSVKLGLFKNVYVNNSLISFYSECGDLWMAKRVFDEMPNKDVVSWNAILIGCLRNGELDLGLDLFRKMGRRDVITWNSLITGFVQGGRPKEALMFFHEMLVVGNYDDGGGGDRAGVVVLPDKFTIATVLSACALLGAIDQGRWVHSYLKRNGLASDTVIGTALVDMYGKCGCIKTAVEVFRGIAEKDVLAWTAMISVFALHGCVEEAFDVFKEMEAVGVRPNAVTFVGLLSACAHCGIVGKARWYFSLMKRDYGIEPLVQHYACLVDVLGRAGILDEAEEVIWTMPMEPDVYVWGALLGGCQMHGNVELGERVAKHLIDLEPQNHAFYVNLCDLYAKAGRLDDFKRVKALMNEMGIKKTAPGCSMIEVDGAVHEFSVIGSPEVQMEEIIWVLNVLSWEKKIEGDITTYID